MVVVKNVKEIAKWKKGCSRHLKMGMHTVKLSRDTLINNTVSCNKTVYIHSGEN